MDKEIEIAHGRIKKEGKRGRKRRKNEEEAEQ